MHKIQLYNNIAQVGLDHFDTDFEVAEDIENPDGIVVRSANLHELAYNPELKAIARAGAGVNNIDLEACTERGIVVFNTPGANANAVKELVFTSLLLASRDVLGGIEWCRTQGDNDNLPKDVEKQKKLYAGNELQGKTLGIIGLGAIGVQVANLALRFGMRVYGYDPYMSIDAAWSLSRYVHHATTVEEIYRNADFITIHVPQNDKTAGWINKETIAQMKPGVKILNMARGGLVVDQDILAALDEGKVGAYITDFPNKDLVKHEKVIPIPHLGASTEESEDNCAIKAVQEISEYLKYGNIINSVNMPNARLDDNPDCAARIGVFHQNVPKMISKISDTFSQLNINIENMVNKSRKEVAYTLLDLVQEPGKDIIKELEAVEGIIRVERFK